MPLYEYQCDVCGHRFERIRRFSDPPLADCPKCDGSVRKLMSSPAIQFKGTGWYVTDYAKKSGSDSAETEAGKGKTDSETKKAGAGQTDKGKADTGTTAKTDVSSKNAASNGGSTSSRD